MHKATSIIKYKTINKNKVNNKVKRAKLTGLDGSWMKKQYTLEIGDLAQIQRMMSVKGPYNPKRASAFLFLSGLCHSSWFYEFRKNLEPILKLNSVSVSDPLARDFLL